MRTYSSYALCFSFLFICLVHFFYYPRWTKTKGEATLSWDVSGYYMYLPAAFIYKDIKQCAFKDKILKQYQLSYNWQQACLHDESGNYIMKYSIGQAILFSPAFFVAHAIASHSDRYAADGFSMPYQVSISIWCLIITLLGLIFLRKSLMYYFSEKTVAFCLITLVLGTNYLNYSAIDGAMTHNNLFSIYAILIYSSILFHRDPSLKKALFIGALVGMAALIRPTEIIACIIPICWGIKIDKKSFYTRLYFFKTHSKWLVFSAMVCLLIGSIQLIYWKYASGDWLVYSYEDQGFSWLSPHFWSAMFSYKSGWLTYSPMMGFSLAGFVCLAFRRPEVFAGALFFILVFMYINFSWDVWWYGSSLGQRCMVQAYPVLMFPLAAYFTWLTKRRAVIKTIFIAIMALFICFNFWVTHHAHKGKVLVPGYMTKAYFWKTIFTSEPKQEYLKLLDTDEYFEGERKGIKNVFQSDHDQLTLGKGGSKKHFYRFPIKGDFNWLRVNATLELTEKEWRYWYMTTLKVRFRKGETLVKERQIRVQKLMKRNKKKTIFFDVKKPDQDFNNIEIELRHRNDDKPMYIHGVNVETFK